MLDPSAPKVITFIASVVLALVAVVVHYTRIEVPFTHSGFSILLVGYALLLLATCFGTFSPAIPRAAAAPTEASETPPCRKGRKGPIWQREAQTKEATMRKLALVLFVMVGAMLAGLMTWRAEATPLTGTADSLAVLKSYSTVQKAGCMFGTSRCPAGSKWVCTTHPDGSAKKCICTKC